MKRVLSRVAWSVAVVLVALSVSVAKVELVESEHRIALQKDGVDLWAFNHDPAEGKPYLHPVRAVGGDVFTSLRPEDHPWHRGIWFSWKFINGVNYWEENSETGLSEGETWLLSVDREVDDGLNVLITMRLAYAPSRDAEPVLTETRRLRISAPDENGVYSIDWVSESLVGGEDLVFDRTPLPSEPGGKSWGGYAGYSIRMNGDMVSGRYSNSGELEGERTHGTAARWVSFRSPGGGCIRFMDHPENIRFPAKWYVWPSMGYFSPAILFDRSLALNAGERLKLQYRIQVSGEKVDEEAAWKSWALGGSPPVTVLLLSGQNNHDWQSTTPVIKECLEADGRVEVRVMEKPQSLAKSDFEGVDVVLSNWNSYSNAKGSKAVTDWPDSAKEAYLDFVRKGGGHVVIHAGSTSFPDWDDYFELSLMRWKSGQTAHGKIHEFPLRLENGRHPVVRDLDFSEHRDELWREVEIHPEAIVLASSFSSMKDGGSESWEPSVFVGSFGDGLCFSTTLGHDANSLASPNLQTLIRRGVFWAAKRSK